uniref:C2H2-type domain-containing protein n=2 Tax=Clytia hemisphaerica TaxID=252671 RepID=A0A7M5WYN0_9CNID
MDRLGAIDFMITLKKKIWGQNAPKARDLDDFGRRLPAANEQSSCKDSQRADISTNNAQKDSNSEKSITYLPSSKTNTSLSTPSIASKQKVVMKKSFISDALSSLKSTGCPPINSAYTTINPTLLREALKDDKAQYEKDFSLTKDVKSNVGEKRKSIVIDDDEDTKVINIQPSNKSKRSEPSKSNSQTLDNSLSTDYKISAPAVDAEYEREKNISNKARIDNKASLRVVITDVKEVNMQKVKVAASCPVCGREFKMKQMKQISHHLVRKHGFKVRQALMEEVKQTRLAKCMKQHGGEHILLPCAVDQCDMWFCSDMSFEQHMRMKHCMSMPDVYKARDELVKKHWGGKKVLVKEILSEISTNNKSTLNSNAKSSMEDSMISKSNTEISTRRPTEKSTNTSKSSTSTSTGEEITTEVTRTSKSNAGTRESAKESASIISKSFVGSEALETECDRDYTTDVKESFQETAIEEEKELKSSTRENASDQIKSTENGDTLLGISCEKVSLKAKGDGDIIMVDQSRQEIPEPSIKEEGETSVTSLSCEDSFKVTTQPCQTLEELAQDIQNITTTAKLFIRKAPDLEERLTMICKEVLVDLSEPVRRNFRNKETINP